MKAPGPEKNRRPVLVSYMPLVIARGGQSWLAHREARRRRFQARSEICTRSAQRCAADSALSRGRASSN